MDPILDSVQEVLADQDRTRSGFSICWKLLEEVKLSRSFSRFNHRSESRAIGRIDGYDFQAEAK